MSRQSFYMVILIRHLHDTIRGFSVNWERKKPSVQVEEKSGRIKASTETMNLKFCNWAKLVRILISEGSLSLLKIIGTKSLAEMFTRLVMKEKLKFPVFGYLVAQPQVNPDSTIAQVEQITSFR
ncbi:hypothetical protein Tco_0335427 [Tanacetum coccineum]